MLLLASKKEEGQKSDEFQEQRSKLGLLQSQGVGIQLQLVECRTIRCSVIWTNFNSETRSLFESKSSERARKTAALAEKKLKSKAKQKKITDFHEELARKARAVERVRKITDELNSQGSNLRSISRLYCVTEDSGWMGK